MFRLRSCFNLGISIILFVGGIRCECDFDDSTNSYNSTESNEIFVAMTGEDEDYVDMGEAVCSESCQNGCCIDRDTCLCHNGYQPSHIDKFDCEPICGDADIDSTGCTNGVCISPQVCECLDGFVLSQMHPFTCITAGDNNDGDDDTHELRDTTFVFWILTGVGLIFIVVMIIALITWTSYERKTTYIVDENGTAVAKYIVADNKLDSQVIICIKNDSGLCEFQRCTASDLLSPRPT